METPGSSADGLVDTQAPFLELENADHQMLEPRGPEFSLLAAVPAVSFQERLRTGTKSKRICARGDGGGSHDGERPQVNATASREGRVGCSVESVAACEAQLATAKVQTWQLVLPLMLEMQLVGL
jgi:hypothetical protein